MVLPHSNFDRLRTHRTQNDFVFVPKVPRDLAPFAMKVAVDTRTRKDEFWAFCFEMSSERRRRQERLLTRKACRCTELVAHSVEEGVRRVLCVVQCRGAQLECAGECARRTPRTHLFAPVLWMFVELQEVIHAREANGAVRRRSRAAVAKHGRVHEVVANATVHMTFQAGELIADAWVGPPNALKFVGGLLFPVEHVFAERLASEIPASFPPEVFLDHAGRIGVLCGRLHFFLF